MGIKVKSIDSRSSLKRFVIDAFAGTASNNILYAVCPFNGTFEKAIFTRGVASAACICDVSNVTLSAAIIPTQTLASASGVAGTKVEFMATGSFEVRAGDLLKTTVSSTTTDGALALQFIRK